MIKIPFKGINCDQIDYSNLVKTEFIDDELLMCHTLRDNLIVLFYHSFANLLDEKLTCRYKTVWRNLHPVLRILERFGVAACHPDSEQTGFICVFNVTGENLNNVDCKSIYDKRLAKVTQYIGKTWWMLRLMVN